MKKNFWPACAVIAALLHLAESFLEPSTFSHWLHWITKPIPMIALLALLPVWSPRRDFYRLAIMVGFLFSLAGDVFLMLPYDLFIMGLVSFLIAHVCYIAALCSGGVRLYPLRLLPFLVYGGLTLRVLWPGLGDMKIPVLAYIVVILLMGWRAAARVGHGGERIQAQWAALLGAAIFIISDSLIAFDKFHGAIPSAHFWVMVTYWLGQLGIGRSVRRQEIHF